MCVLHMHAKYSLMYWNWKQAASKKETGRGCMLNQAVCVCVLWLHVKSSFPSGKRRRGGRPVAHPKALHCCGVVPGPAG